MKKVLILYTSVGLGHKSIAENIGYHLGQRGYDIHLADILNVEEGAWVRFGTGLHRWLNNVFPPVWRFLYRYGHVIFSPLRTVVASRNYLETKQLVDAYQPDVIIATQTSASAVVDYLKKKKLYQGKMVVAFSDYHFHPYWIYPETDLYLTNIPEQGAVMARLGIPADRIALCGITLQPLKEIDGQAVRASLQIPAEARVVLFSSGSLGTSFEPSWLIEAIKQITKDQNAHALVVCGKNSSLHETLSQTGFSINVHLFGFHRSMEDLYYIADVMVGKPGGLTLAETWQMKLPVIVTSYLPGQEEFNYNYIIEKGLVIPGMKQNKTISPQELQGLVAKELSTGSFRKSLVSNPLLVQLVQDDSQKSPVVEAIDRQI